MTGPVRVYLDETPGETRGVLADDRGWRRLLIDFDDDDPRVKLGARSVARVARIEPNLKGVFVDLGEGLAQAFLPVGKVQRLHVGQKIEVEVVAEPRETKGATVRWLGEGQGAPRLLTPPPTVRDWLARLAPGVTPIEGAAAIEAGWDALREAVDPPPSGGDLIIWIERTRALIAVDLDHQPAAGRRATPRDRQDANRRGLWETARRLGLSGLGGLVAIDLIGSGHDGDALLKIARAAFGDDPDIAFGPVNRFGVMMVATPWRFQPLEERLFTSPGSRSLQHRAAATEATRRLRRALLGDTTAPRITVRCAPPTAERAAPLVARLGPRAHVSGDDALAHGAFAIDTD